MHQDSGSDSIYNLSDRIYKLILDDDNSIFDPLV